MCLTAKQAIVGEPQADALHKPTGVSGHMFEAGCNANDLRASGKTTRYTTSAAVVMPMYPGTLPLLPPHASSPAMVLDHFQPHPNMMSASLRQDQRNQGVAWCIGRDQPVPWLHGTHCSKRKREEEDKQVMDMRQRPRAVRYDAIPCNENGCTGVVFAYLSAEGKLKCVPNCAHTVTEATRWEATKAMRAAFAATNREEAVAANKMRRPACALLHTSIAVQQANRGAAAHAPLQANMVADRHEAVPVNRKSRPSRASSRVTKAARQANKGRPPRAPMHGPNSAEQPNMAEELATDWAFLTSSAAPSLAASADADHWHSLPATELGARPQSRGSDQTCFSPVVSNEITMDFSDALEATFRYMEDPAVYGAGFPAEHRDWLDFVPTSPVSDMDSWDSNSLASVSIGVFDDDRCGAVQLQTWTSM